MNWKLSRVVNLAAWLGMPPLVVEGRFFGCRSLYGFRMEVPKFWVAGDNERPLGRGDQF
jgi:hypothetical protein